MINYEIPHDIENLEEHIIAIHLKNVIPETVICSKYNFNFAGNDRSQNGAAITISSAIENCFA